MANSTISGLPVAGAIGGTEPLPVVQSGATKQSTPAALLTYVNANAAIAASQITSGTLAVARGGTNIGSYTTGDLLYASAAGVLSALAGVATGNALISGGVATAPAWGKIGLTTHISGTLAAANGGTGIANGASASLTLPNAATTITTGGTLALGGFTLTVPATGTAALLEVANSFTAAQTAIVTDAGTNTQVDALVLGHNSSGTPAASFGVNLHMTLHSSTTTNQDAALITARWVTATHGSRKSRLVLNTYDTGVREFLRGEASGSAAMIGFLGASAAIRQTAGAATAGAVYTSAEQTMLQVVYDALRTFGLTT